jgi:hypothetical protein
MDRRKFIQGVSVIAAMVPNRAGGPPPGMQHKQTLCARQAQGRRCGRCMIGLILL